MRRRLVPLVVSALAASLLTLGAAAVAPPAAAAVADLRINEVESNDAAGGPDFVELTNVGTEPVDAGGLLVKDSGESNTLTVPAGTTIAPGAYVALDTSGIGTNDSARLLQGDTLLDSYSWGPHASTTYGRCPDGVGGFRTTTSVTKGAANDCRATLRITEIESSDAAGGSDWVEVHNYGADPVDAGGLLLKDSGESNTLTIPAGTTIAPSAYAAFDVTGLDTFDSARLLQGTVVLDSYAWGPHASTTYGRCPGPAGDVTTTASNTKGAANDCGVVVPAGLTFNEVESNGDPIGDFAELVNTGTAAVDLSGYRFTDSDVTDPTHRYPVPAGTSVPAGGTFVFAEADFGFGLGGADSVRLEAPDGSLVDSYSWTAHATTSYGRCPDRTGPFVTTTSTTRGVANDCAGAVRINEIESSGGTPGDWVELTNVGSSAADVSGVRVADSGEPGYTLPAGTIIEPGGFLVVEEAQIGSGLGQPDAARLIGPGGAVLDSYAWQTHASTTYGRCPSGTGGFTTTQQPTKGTTNRCPGDLDTSPWPGGADVATIDPAGVVGSDLSGLAFEPATATAPDVLLGVRNGTGSLLRFTEDAGGVWNPTTTQLRYPGGLGVPDAEGIALSGTGSAGGVYVATERDGAASGVSRPSILRFEAPTAAGGELTATDEWNVAADLPSGLGANAGLEGIAFVPDSYLVGRGLLGATGQPYDPAAYPDHRGGLFLVGVEATGRVYAYALDHTSGAATLVTSFASGFPIVADLHFEAERQQLWVVCDEVCQGRSALFDVTAGAFAPVTYLERPAGMPNIANEGFTLAPRSACVGGLKPAYWADDANTGGHALREGTVSCTPVAAQTVVFTSTPPPAPVVGQTWTLAATGGGSGNPVTFSSLTPAVCTVSGSTVTAVATGACVVQADQAGSDDFVPGRASQGVTVARARSAVDLVVGPESLTATISVLAPGAAPVAGEVTFLVDGAVAGVVPVSDGVATLDAAVPPGRERTVQALYGGSPLLTASNDAVERADPTITAEVSSPRPVSASGWYTAPVTVTFSCAPAEPDGAPLAEPCPAPVVLDTSGAGQSVGGSVAAEDGGVGTVTVEPLDLDLDAPSVRVAGVADGETFRLAPPTPRCAAGDPVSGVAVCEVVSRQRGLRVTVTASAVDVAGNRSVATASYRLPAVKVAGALRHVDGRYVIERGATYRLLARLPSGPAARLVGPVPLDARLRGDGVAMTGGGDAAGLTEWRRGVRVTGAGRLWKVAVVSGGRREVVRLTVLR